MATIHVQGNGQWDNARIIGEGVDNLTGEQETLIVQQDQLGWLDFYKEADEQGRHYQVGNAAFYLTVEDNR